MKKFIREAILFSLCLFAACLGIEFYLLTVSNEYSYKKWYVENQGDKIKILVLGHSHAGNGINPKYMGDSVFNMAIQSRNVFYDAVIAQRYIPILPNLKCVIWSLGYDFQYNSYKYPLPSSSGTDALDYASTYRCMYAKYFGISYEDEFPYKYWSELIYSNFDYGKRIFTRDFESKHLCDSLGFESYPVSNKVSNWRQIGLPVKKRDYNHPNSDKAFKHSLEYMKQIAQVCKETNVRLIVLSFPCHQSYVDLTTSRGMEEMRTCVKSMQAVYPAMEYYNYMTDKRFVDDDFCNAGHLSDVGAMKFSSIVKDEILQLKSNR